MSKDDLVKKALSELGVERSEEEEEVEEGFNFDTMKENLALELKKAREYIEEKKKITPKPEEYKKLTTLSDAEERSILSDLNVKESVLETININPGSWMPEIKRLTLEVAALRFRLEEYKIKEEKEE